MLIKLDKRENLNNKKRESKILVQSEKIKESQ